GSSTAAHLIKVRSPAAGRYSVTAYALTGRSAPRPRILGKVPSYLTVAAGIARTKARPGRYVLFVVVLNRQGTGRHVQGVAAGDATFYVSIDPGSGVTPAGQLTLRDAI